MPNNKIKINLLSLYQNLNEGILHCLRLCESSELANAIIDNLANVVSDCKGKLDNVKTSSVAASVDKQQIEHLIEDEKCLNKDIFSCYMNIRKALFELAYSHGYCKRMSESHDMLFTRMLEAVAKLNVGPFDFSQMTVELYHLTTDMLLELKRLFFFINDVKQRLLADYDYTLMLSEQDGVNKSIAACIVTVDELLQRDFSLEYSTTQIKIDGDDRYHLRFNGRNIESDYYGSAMKLLYQSSKLYGHNALGTVLKAHLKMSWSTYQNCLQSINSCAVNGPQKLSPTLLETTVINSVLKTVQRFRALQNLLKKSSYIDFKFIVRTELRRYTISDIRSILTIYQDQYKDKLVVLLVNDCEQWWFYFNDIEHHNAFCSMPVKNIPDCYEIIHQYEVESPNLLKENGHIEQELFCLFTCHYSSNTLPFYVKRLLLPLYEELTLKTVVDNVCIFSERQLVDMLHKQFSVKPNFWLVMDWFVAACHYSAFFGLGVNSASLAIEQLLDKTNRTVMSIEFPVFFSGLSKRCSGCVVSIFYLLALPCRDSLYELGRMFSCLLVDHFMVYLKLSHLFHLKLLQSKHKAMLLQKCLSLCLFLAFNALTNVMVAIVGWVLAELTTEFFVLLVSVERKGYRFSPWVTKFSYVFIPLVIVAKVFHLLWYNYLPSVDFWLMLPLLFELKDLFEYRHQEKYASRYINIIRFLIHIPVFTYSMRISTSLIQFIGDYVTSCVILNVSPFASKLSIRRQFFKLALLYHPDKLSFSNCQFAYEACQLRQELPAHFLSSNPTCFWSCESSYHSCKSTVVEMAKHSLEQARFAYKFLTS